MLRSLTSAAALLLAAGAYAQTEDSPQPTPIPVPAAQPPADETPAMPEDLPLYDWTLNANLQQDGLAHANVESDRKHTTRLRRARISAVVDYDFDWEAKIGVDFAQGADLREATLEYRTERWSVEGGRMIEPFSLLQSSSTGSPFMERPLALGIAPGYGLGGAANAHGAKFGITAGAFSATKNDVFFGGREEKALTIRATATPASGKDWRLHVGGAISQRTSGEGFLQFVAVPETVLIDGLNIDSTQILTEDYTLYGTEAALQYGALLLEGEWLQARVGESVQIDFNTGNYALSAPRYSGWYAEASWAITGEKRDYSVAHGTFSGIVPAHALGHGGSGAWLIGVRYSTLDLSDPQVGGERGKVVSASVSWLPDPRVRVVLEGKRISEIGPLQREDVNAVQLRVQLYFTDLIAMLE